MEPSANKWVLVTGVKGFVGTKVAQKLIKNGYQVVGMMREGFKNDDSINTFCTNWATLSELSDFFQNKQLFAVIHIATNYGIKGSLIDVLESNVDLPLRLLELCASLSCKIFLTTDTFFGKPEFDYSHMKAYIYSKKDFVHWASLFCEKYSLMRISNLRLEHVYGYGDKLNKFVPDMIQKLQRNQLVIPMSKGEQLRDFIHVDDVANAYLTLLFQGDHLPPGLTEYEVGTGISTSIKDFVELLHKSIGSQSIFNFGDLPYRHNEIMASKAITDKLTQYGWTASTSVFKGLSSTLEHMKVLCCVENRNDNEK